MDCWLGRVVRLCACVLLARLRRMTRPATCWISWRWSTSPVSATP